MGTRSHMGLTLLRFRAEGRELPCAANSLKLTGKEARYYLSSSLSIINTGKYRTGRLPIILSTCLSLRLTAQRALDAKAALTTIAPSLYKHFAPQRHCAVMVPLLVTTPYKAAMWREILWIFRWLYATISETIVSLPVSIVRIRGVLNTLTRIRFFLYVTSVFGVQA